MILDTASNLVHGLSLYDYLKLYLNQKIFHNFHASGHEEFSTGSDLREQLLMVFEVLGRLLVVDFHKQGLMPG